MAKKLPLYELKVSGIDTPLSAVTFTALVDEPAIESYAMCFSDNKQMEFAVENEDRRIVTGAAMIPDMKIYRNDQNGEYNVFFTKDTIELIMKKWAKQGRHNNVNIMHERDNIPQGVYLTESFMVDSKRGMSAPKILKGNFPDGTWIKSYFVENDDVWSKFKSGIYKGFSEEGFFDMVMEFAKPKDEKTIELDIEALLNFARL